MLFKPAMSFRCNLFAAVTSAACLLSTTGAQAETGDIENSKDYTGFTRLPGYVITDYADETPAEYDFPVSRPTTLDSNHLETVQAKGRRYIIHYEIGAGATPVSLYQMQQHFEKLASATGFTCEKSGAVGDVSESFHLSKASRDSWVYLEPAITSYVLTIVEGKGEPPPPSLVKPATAPVPAVTPTPATAPVAATPPVAPKVDAATPPVTTPAIAPETTPATTATSGPDDAFYTSLMQDGSVVLPLKFTAGKPDLADDSQPVIDRVIAMMKRHPDMQLEVDGHTDGRGDPDFNKTISKQRAMAVRAQIVEGGIEKKRLTAVGFGSEKPKVKETTREDRDTNRRIELVIRPDAEKDPEAKAPVKKKSTTSRTQRKKTTPTN